LERYYHIDVDMSKNDEEKRQKRKTRCAVICDSEMQYMIEKIDTKTKDLPIYEG
jgi:hypothetical protein